MRRLVGCQRLRVVSPVLLIDDCLVSHPPSLQLPSSVWVSRESAEFRTVEKREQVACKSR